MAKIITGDQRLVTGAKNPKAVYSRVVSVLVDFEEPVREGFEITAGLGNRLWLLGVDVWVECRQDIVLPNYCWAVYFGSGVPADIAALRNWNQILPIKWQDSFVVWRTYQQEKHWHFDMTRLFEGNALRFGAYGEGTGAKIGHFEFAFEISEG